MFASLTATTFVLDTLDQRLLPVFGDRAPLPRRLRRAADTRLVRRALARPSRTVAVGGLPARVRTRLGIPWSRLDQVHPDVIEWITASTWGVLPGRLRWQPRAIDGRIRTIGRLP